MKQIIIGGLLAGLGLAPVAFAAETLAEQQPEKVEKPSFKPGDRLVYQPRDLLTKVAGEDEVQIVKESGATGTVFASPAGDVVRVFDADWAATQSDGINFNPPIRALAFPLFPGKSWSHDNVFQNPVCGKQTNKLKSEVKGWEEVEVPAGRFKALRIESKGYWQNYCGRDQLNYVFWYSPEARALVRSESVTYANGRVFSGTIRELKAYKLD